MGLEASCWARWDGKEGAGKAHLDTARLDFRGAFRVSVAFAEMKKVEARDGVLEVRWKGGVLALELGSAAEKWRQKIVHPKGRIDKLGVKTGQRVAVVGVSDEDFLAELRERTADVTTGRPKQECDVIFFAASSRKDLARLEGFASAMKPDAALWVIREKGGKAEIGERDVMAAGKAAGYVDVKVVSFSDTQTAEKFVIPVARRRGA